ARGFAVDPQVELTEGTAGGADRLVARVGIEPGLAGSLEIARVDRALKPTDVVFHRPQLGRYVALVEGDRAGEIGGLDGGVGPRGEDPVGQLGGGRLRRRAGDGAAAGERDARRPDEERDQD